MSSLDIAPPDGFVGLNCFTFLLKFSCIASLFHLVEFINQLNINIRCDAPFKAGKLMLKGF